LLSGFAVLALTDHVPRSGLAVPTFADAGRVLTVDETVFLYAANRDFNDAISIFADDRFLGDDIGNVVAYGFTDFLPMA
jgi:hypothetical protein